MNNNYSSVTLTIDDIEPDERCSTFTNCTFNETVEDESIKGVNFSFAEFTDCTWNVNCIESNFKGASGNSLPPLTNISFSEPLPLGEIVSYKESILFIGDGNTDEFEVKLLDVSGIEETLSNRFPELTVQVVAGKVDSTCGIGDASINKTTFQAITDIELTTDATDTATPINGIPDITADGTSNCAIYIKKKDRAGNYLTDAGDDDTITLESTRGKLSTLQIDLVNGEAEVTLTSVAETCVSDIKASADGMESVSIQIQFAP